MGHSRKVKAFTRKELMLVIAVLVVLVLFLVPGMQRVQQKSQRLTCIGNLKVLGTAYRIWANCNGDHFPAFAALTNGGWSDFLYRTNASSYAWTNYTIMADEFGHNLLTLVCPADERRPATALQNLDNTNISYFVGVGADDTYPQSLLGGDRNLGPGTTPDSEYGFSPPDGKGNDVVINGPVCWSLKMHSRGNPAGGGNILLGDGSAQQTTSRILAGYWMKNALEEKVAHDKATNSAGMRLIFP